MEWVCRGHCRDVAGRLFHDFQRIQGFVVLPGIVVVLGQCGGKVVTAREVVFGAHIDVVVFVVVENRLYGPFGGDAYRPGRETVMFVGVVG